MVRTSEWDETFMEEMLEEVKDAVERVSRSRKKEPTETLRLQAITNRGVTNVSITVRREGR